MDAGTNSLDASPSCPGCREAARRIAKLERQNALLEAQVAELEAKLETALRSGKRQAAPFSKGLPKADPKKPGRKPGDDYGTKAFRSIPPHIDEIHEAPLPPCCPHCGGTHFIEQRVEHQYQAEIPRRPIYRQFNVALARCACCDKRVQGRHPLQTSDALGCCASQVGPEAQAAVVMLNKELGLSQGKISRFFQSFFGIKLTRGGSCQIMLRAADRCEGNYQDIVKHVQESDTITPDETGWRIGGRPAWLHVAATPVAVAYLVHRRRGYEASVKLIGEDYAGTLIHDGYAPYDRYWLATHQTCITHLLRRCDELLERAKGARGAAAVFPRKVKAILQEGLEARDRRDAGEITLRGARCKATVLQKRLLKLATPRKTNGPNDKLAGHLVRHIRRMFTFLREEGVDATNWRAEQAIRPAVVNRKVWGGNRTDAGAAAQGILMSVLFTAQKQGTDALSFLSSLLRARKHERPLLLPRSS